MLVESGRSRILMRRIVLALLASLGTALILGILYQNLSLVRERGAHPMPGRLVDVGGYRMHIYCTGVGAPAVILDSGLGDSYIAWQRVQPEIAKLVQACSY